MAHLEIADAWVFEGGDGPSDGWYLSKMTGWRDGPAPRVDVQLRPQGHGGFSPGVTFKGARVVSVEGSFRGETIEQSYSAMARLAALGGDGKPFKFAFSDESGTRFVTAWLANGPTMPEALWQPFFKWAFDIVAVDPRKYDLPIVSSVGLPVSGGGYKWPARWPARWGTREVTGRLTFTNTGYADSAPLFEISGGMPDGFLLAEVGTGREIRFEDDIPVGSTLFLNPRTGLAMLDDVVDRSGKLTRSDWWSVAPGQTSSVQFSSLGGAVGDPQFTGRFSSANW